MALFRWNIQRPSLCFLYCDTRYYEFQKVEDGDDTHFCDLVHLVNHSYNTLNEVGQPNDMDNSHMLSVKEQSMSADDRKVWAGELERDKNPATLRALVKWMTMEINSRMRAAAPIRSGVSNKQYVNHIAAEEVGNENMQRKKCWICKDSIHWADQCYKFKALGVDERLRAADGNHAYFSCLKKAGHNHKIDNCLKGRQCYKQENGIQCVYKHHPLLRKNKSIKIGVATISSETEAVLPVLLANSRGENSVFKCGNVLLDSGAQVSLFLQSTAQILGLKGKDTSVTITKVVGENEIMMT